MGPFTSCFKKTSGTEVMLATPATLHKQLEGVKVKPIFILGFISPHVDMEAVARAVKEAFPNTAMLLATTAGELCTCAPDMYCTTEGNWQTMSFQFFDATVFASVEMLPIPLGAEDLRKGLISLPLADRVEAIADTLRNADIYTKVHFQDTLAYTLVDGLSLSESFFIEAVYRSERFPCIMVGGSAGGSAGTTQTLLHDGNRAYQNHAIITLLKMAPGVQFGILKSQNFEPTPHVFTIEQSSAEFRYVDTVRTADGQVRNIVEALCTALSTTPDKLMEALADASLALHVRGDWFVRTIARLDTDIGRAHFYCDIATGEQLTLVRRTSIIEQTTRDFKTFMSGKPRRPFSGILNDCVCRRLYNAPDLPGLKNIFCDIKVNGFSTFGELLGLNINQTLTAVFFFRVKPHEYFGDHYHTDFIQNYATWSSFFNRRSAIAIKNQMNAYMEALQQVLVRSRERTNNALSLAKKDKAPESVRHVLEDHSDHFQRESFLLLEQSKSIYGILARMGALALKKGNS